MITIVVRGWPFVVVPRGSRPSARETRRVHPDGDVLPPVLHRLRAGAELNEPDATTFYAAGPHGYTDYPTLTESVTSPSA